MLLARVELWIAHPCDPRDAFFLRTNASKASNLTLSSQSKPNYQANNTTMKCAIFSTLLVGTAAFAPAQTGKASTALQADLTAEVGAQAPLGCFDPLGVLGDPKDGDQEQFDQLRYIELKHGRVAMLAFVGYIVTYVSCAFLQLASLFD